MQTKLILIFGCFLVQSALGQQKSFVSNHNLSVAVTGNMPLLSGSFKSTLYKPADDEMVEGRDWFDYGFSASYTYQLKPRLALGVLAGLQMMQVAPETVFGKYFFRESGYQGKDSTGIRSENVGIAKYSFMPVAEFYPKNTTGILGMYYKLGIGYSLASIQRGGYAYSLQGDAEDSWTEVDYYNFDEEWEKIRSIQLLFGAGVRTALTKNLFFDFGINYNFNLAIKPTDESLRNSSNELFNFNDTYYNFRREQLCYITLKCGLSLTF